MGRAGGGHHDVEGLHRDIAIDGERCLQSERTDAADFVAGDLGDLLEAEHFRFSPEQRLHLLVVHARGARGDDQHDAFADAQRQRLGDARRLDAIGFCGKRHRCRALLGYDDCEVGGFFGEEGADGFKAHFRILGNFRMLGNSRMLVDQDSWKATTFGSSDSERMRWSTSMPSESICVRNAQNIVTGGTLSLSTQASAIASGVTRSIQATLSPNALAPQASQGLEDTNSTLLGATPSFSLISV